MPKHDDLVVAGRHDARVHALLGLCGLQRNPGFGPRRTGGRLQGRYTTVRQRRRPVKLGGWIGQGDQPSQVAVLDRTEYLAHDLDVLLWSHCSLPARVPASASTATLPNKRIPAISPVAIT